MYRYAVAVRESLSPTPLLFMWVKVVSDPKHGGHHFYAFLPRPHDTTIIAHASYHADGRYHWKTHDAAFNERSRQKPDQTFMGSENLLEQRIRRASAGWIAQECKVTSYNQVFEIPIEKIGNGDRQTNVSVDLVSNGYQPKLVSNANVIDRREYRDVFPYIVFTLYEMPKAP